MEHKPSAEQTVPTYSLSFKILSMGLIPRDRFMSQNKEPQVVLCHISLLCLDDNIKE